MSRRNPNTDLVTTLRNIETRLNKLETAYNNSIKRNDIRIGDIVISAEDDHGLLVATNVKTKEQTSFAKMHEQAWSYPGVVTITSTVADTAPPYVTPHDLKVTDIILAFTEPTTAQTVVDVTIANKIVTCTIEIGQLTSVTLVNVGVFKHQQIYPTLISTGGFVDHDLTVIARFGVPIYIPEVRFD